MLDPRDFLRPKTADAPDGEEVQGSPLGGTREERIQRLQVGGGGILAMVMIIALADVVGSRVAENEAASVPEAAPTVAATEEAAPRDPLAEAGVVPELPAEPEPTESSAPEQEATEDVPEPSSNAQLQ